MKIRYSYITGGPPWMNPMVSGGVYKISGEGELLEVFKNIAHNSRIADSAGEVLSWVKDIQFEVIAE